MKHLSNNDLKQINGGAFLEALVATFIAIGAAASCYALIRDIFVGRPVILPGKPINELPRIPYDETVT